MDHHALQGRLHAELHHLACAVRRRAGGQTGQGTVEYVALILLVGVLLGTSVALAGGAKFDLAATVRDKISDAIQGLGGKAGSR